MHMDPTARALLECINAERYRWQVEKPGPERPKRRGHGGIDWACTALRAALRVMEAMGAERAYRRTTWGRHIGYARHDRALSWKARMRFMRKHPFRR